LPGKSRKAYHLAENKISGSIDLVSQLNSFIEKNIDKPEVIEKAVQNAKRNQSAFQAMNNYLRNLKKAIKSGDKKKLKLFLKQYKKEAAERFSRIYENLKHLLINKSKVVTISNSRTVLEVMKLWHHENKDIHVIAAESRPMNEGHKMAKHLLQAGIKVTVITDFNISDSISKVDAVIIGADSVFRNGNVVNKTGSRAAAIICNYYKKPFYVLAGSDKFSKKISDKSGEQNPDEVWRYRHKNLKIKNNYFEIVENKLITNIISDKIEKS
jgi:translation initiation factor eIF-2B subunit delta